MEELGVEYDTLTVNLQDKSDEFKALYAKANPLPNARAKVPVLQVDDGLLTLCESIVVTEYLAESLGDGTQLQPASAADRARGRLFTELCSGAFSYFPILRARDDAEKTAADPVATERAIEAVQEGGPLFRLDRDERHGTKDGGFASYTVTKTSTTVQYHAGGDGKVLYTATPLPPRRWRLRPP